MFQKRKAERKPRKHEFKTPRANSYLIVTEGERTEPLYFKGIQKKIRERIGGTIDIEEAPIIDVSGEGRSTGKLIEIAERLIKNAKIIYQNVWIVFDKDDFPDFDAAVKAGTDKGYHVARNNQCFEYWLYLHFAYSDSALHRDEWNAKLNDIFKRNRLGDGTYRKNYDNIYDLVNINHGVDTAIKHAKRCMSNYAPDKLPSQCNPGTTVFLLAEELLKYLEN